ncbi:MAG: TIGR03619 family F420-dependent LLM class oxidoreductase [Gammaproteobacteria bacterium]
MAAKKSSGIGVGVFQVIADLFTGDPAVVAKRAEALGFDSYWLPEHAAIPQGSDAVYPGKVEGGATPDYLFKMPDPLIGLTRAAAVTSTIKLGTGVALVPERHPVLAAKEIASLDHYSKGRFIYGIGAGWNEPECTMMGGDFAHRWTQVKEYIAAMKQLRTGEYVGAQGKYANFPPAVCRPTPWRKPHPPILLGSIGSPNVYRRVVQWGDGWLPFVVDPQEVADGRAALDRYAQELGRDPKSINVTAFAPDGMFRKKTDIATLAKAGADNVVLWLQGENEAAILQELETLAAEVFG